MDEQERDFLQEDDIEITDLDDPRTGDSSIFRGFGHPHFVARKYRRPITVITICIVMLGIIAISFAPLRDLLVQNSLISPSATSQPSNFFYGILADPPWGQLFVDGKRASPVVAGNNVLIRFTAGRYVLEWRAAPFAPQRCILSVPMGDNGDTCRYSIFHVGGSGSDQYPVLTFFPSLRLLAADQRSALVSAVQAALNDNQVSAVVQPGEFYAQPWSSSTSGQQPCKLAANSVICYKVATQPLHATLSYQLDLDTAPTAPCSDGECIFNGYDCRLFCSLSLFNYMMGVPHSRRTWQAFAIAHVFWTFTTLDGTMVEANQPDTFIGGMHNEHIMPLAISWNGTTWHVETDSNEPDLPFSDPVCDTAVADAYNLAAMFPYKSQQVPSMFELIPAANRADGCLVVVTASTEANGPPIPSPTALPVAYCLHRFGVLLAANETAHRYWPFLPVASAAEQQLAQQLVSQG
ncbi:MAG TPA: hypothetical protein VFA41_04065 [Ktedonobacteraceae bacterium]|jgi:hypothetical protein|nr:hypothetical protein [Ktedonobacteraceae bacterium]